MGEPTPKDKKKEIEKTTIFNKQDAEKKKKIKAYQDKKKEDRDRKEQGDKGEKPDDTDDNKKETKTEITEIEEDKEMCPDIKKWLLGGSLENNCAYTSSGCPRCFGKTHRCSFDYKKKRAA